MPVRVKHIPTKSGKDYAIVEKSTGRVVGRSETREKAQKSANARNASLHGWHPSKRR
jgi:hypothetical protein